MLPKKFTDKEWHVSRRDTNFAATRRIFRFRSKSSGTNFYRFLLLRQLHGQLGDDSDESQQSTFSTWSSSIEVQGRQDLGSSSMDVLPDLKRWYHSWHFVRIKQSSPKVCRTIWKASVKDYPYLKQFNANALLLKILHLSTWKNRRNTHSFKSV